MSSRVRLIAAVLQLAVGLHVLLAAATAGAQGVSEIVSPAGLPRPGYEPRNIRFGSTVVSPDLSVTQTYDSNVFSLPGNEEDDLVTTISPRIRVEAGPGKLQLYSDAFAAHAEYLENPSESRTTYGASVGGQYLLNRANTVEAAIEYNREAESRGDPESDLGSGDPISLLHRFGGTVRYGYRRNRLGLDLTGGIEQIDFDTAADSERDVTQTRVAARTSLLLTPQLDAFVEGYSSRRDYDSSTDASGVDRDATTYGFLTGMSINLTGKLVGEIGVGLFQTDYDDDGLDEFLGFGMQGALRWSVSPRTLLAATVAREDVGTVLAGATSQVQTDFGLRLEQEVRHNFLLSTDLLLSQREYGGIARDLTTVSAGITGELLLNRMFSLVASANYSTRFADLRTDEYDRLMLTLGLRVRF